MKIPWFWQEANVARVAVAGCGAARRGGVPQRVEHRGAIGDAARHQVDDALFAALHLAHDQHQPRRHDGAAIAFEMPRPSQYRSEEHTSELQSLMRNSYAVFCLKKTKQLNNPPIHPHTPRHKYSHTH